MATKPDVPPAGVWAPAVTLFDPETDKLLLDDQKKYYAYLASTGLAGLVILGSNAEKFLLTRDERAALVRAAREAVGPDFPIMAGVSGHSTAQVLEYMADAKAAGANYALLLPPSYFGAKASPPAVITRFYDDVAVAAAKLPLPIVVYNFPAVCNGIDLDSDTIAGLALRHPGVIVGVKLTCGSVAKVSRLAAELPASQFAIYGGQADFLIGALSVGAVGCISAFANICPKTVVKIYRLWTGTDGTAAGSKDVRTAEAREADRAAAVTLHQKAALAERPCKNGIATTKYAAAVYTAGRYAGIADAEAKLQPRRPYIAPGEADKTRCRELLAEMVAYEATL